MGVLKLFRSGMSVVLAEDPASVAKQKHPGKPHVVCFYFSCAYWFQLKKAAWDKLCPIYDALGGGYD